MGNPSRPLGQRARTPIPVKESAVNKRVRLGKNARSKSKSVTSAPAPRWTLFGQPGLLDGEDAAAYDELLARIHDAVKPGDIIEEMLISDVASLELEYCSYADHFAGYLERILKDHVKEGEDPHSLARRHAENETGAVQRIKIICDYNRVCTTVDWICKTSWIVRGLARQKNSCNSMRGRRPPSNQR
jgi:hypothetical protein